MPKKEDKSKEKVKNSKDKTSFFKSFKAELKRVVWPTPKQLFNNTLAVLLIVIVTTLIVFVLDLVFESMNKYGLDKIKESVSNSASNNITDNTVDNTTEENNQVTENVEENTAE